MELTTGDSDHDDNELIVPSRVQDLEKTKPQRILVPDDGISGSATECDVRDLEKAVRCKQVKRWAKIAYILVAGGAALAILVWLVLLLCKAFAIGLIFMFFIPFIFV